MTALAPPAPPPVVGIRISVGSQIISSGSGVAMSRTVVLTALSVVAAYESADPKLYPGQIELRFGSAVTEGHVLAKMWSVRDDWVLLESASPLPFEERKLAELQGLGGACTIVASVNGGPESITLAGRNRGPSRWRRRRSTPVVELTEGGGDGDRHRLTGAPIFVGDALAGIVRAEPDGRPSGERVLPVCPIEAVARGWPALRIKPSGAASISGGEGARILLPAALLSVSLIASIGITILRRESAAIEGSVTARQVSFTLPTGGQLQRPEEFIRLNRLDAGGLSAIDLPPRLGSRATKIQTGSIRLASLGGTDRGMTLSLAFEAPLSGWSHVTLRRSDTPHELQLTLLGPAPPKLSLSLQERVRLLTDNGVIRDLSYPVAAMASLVRADGEPLDLAFTTDQADTLIVARSLRARDLSFTHEDPSFRSPGGASVPYSTILEGTLVVEDSAIGVHKLGAEDEIHFDSTSRFQIAEIVVGPRSMRVHFTGDVRGARVTRGGVERMIAPTWLEYLRLRNLRFLVALNALLSGAALMKRFASVLRVSEVTT